MAAERRAHDARELPDGVSQARPDPARRVRLGVPAARLRERRERGRASTCTASPAVPSSTTSTTTAASTSWCRHRASRTRRGSSGTGATARSRTARTSAGLAGRDGRPEHGPGRLRQRRPRRRAGAARRRGWARRCASRSRCCATRATAPSRTSPRRRGCWRIARRPRPRPGSTTTATAGSTSSWATRLAPNGLEEPSPCELFHNNRDGTFTNVAPESGVDFVGFVKGVASGDYNNDGRPDLYVSVQGADNLLFRNDGPAATPRGWRFTEVAHAGGRHRADQSASAPSSSTSTTTAGTDLFVRVGAIRAKTTAADVAADYLGLPTLAERGRLYRNQGDGTFEDVTRAAGLYKVVPADGAQLRRPGQRRLAGRLPRHGQPGLRDADPQPHVPERRGAGASRT